MASNNSEDYIHPIIQAMMATVENNRRIADQKLNAQKLVEETRTNKAHEGLTQQSQDKLEKHNQDLHDIALQELEVNRKRAEAELEGQKITRSLAIAEHLKSGALKAPIKHEGVPGVMGKDVPQPFTLPGTNQVIDPSVYSNPDEAGAQTLKLRAAEAKATRDAQFGYMQDVNKLPPSPTDKLHAETAKYNADEATTRAFGVAGMRSDDASAKSDAMFKQAMAVALLKGAQQGVAPEVINGLQEDMAVGNVRPLSGNKTHQIAMAPLEAGKYLLGKPLEDNLKDVQGIQKIRGLLDRYGEFVNTQLSDGKLGSIVTGLKGTSAISNDVKTKYDEINSEVLRLATSLEGGTKARQLAGVMAAEKGGAPRPSDQKKAGIDKVNNLIQRADEMEAAALKGIPFQQRMKLKQAGKIDKLYVHEAQNAQGHTIGTDDGVHWFDESTGTKVQ